MNTASVLSQTVPAFPVRSVRPLKRVDSFASILTRRAYAGPTYHKLSLDGLRPVSELCARTGILTPAWAPLWRRLGVIDGVAPALPPSCGPN